MSIRFPIMAAALVMGFCGANGAAQYPRENFPVTAEDYVSLGIALSSTDPKGALEAFQQAIVLRPAFLEARLSRGRILNRLRRTLEALEDFRSIIEIDPMSTEAESAFEESSLLMERHGDLRSAAMLLSRAIEYFPDRAHLYRARHRVRETLGLRSAARGDFQSARDLEIQEEWIVRAFREERRGYPDSAITHLDLALAEFPNSARLFEVRGMFHMKRNDFIRALQDFTQVIAIRPRHAWGYVLRSQARSRSGDLANALDDTNRAVEIHRRNHLAYRYRSSVRRKLGDTRGAVDDLSRAIEIEPSRRDLYLERGIDRRELNALEGALSDLEKAIALAEPGRRYEKAAAECVAKSRAHRGLIRLAQGRGAEAQADFEAIRIDPSLEGWLRAEIQKAKER